MTSTTSAGTTLALSAAMPTLLDAAGYSALSFTTIGGVESISAFGPQSAVNTFQPLAGGQQKHKGPVNFGSLQLPIAVDKADAGQALLRVFAEPDNNGQASFRVTLPNGDQRYFRGRVFGSPETVGSATNVLMMTATVEIVTRPIATGAGNVFPPNALSLDGTDAMILSLDGTDAGILVLEAA
ncbi:hypothetical protein ACFSGX_13925 [Sphingomonas arantia]|uniref:Uncharacterized protein n=1 Tax=Sphingomonas arantia TaxID=1460676 RepID=A0ABW4U1M8_9SPHN